MKSMLVSVCICSYWMAVLVALFHRASDPLLVCAVFATCGTVALAGLAILDGIAAQATANGRAMNDAIGRVARVRQ